MTFKEFDKAKHVVNDHDLIAPSDNEIVSWATIRRKLELWDKLVKASNAVMDELNATSDVPPNSIYAPKCFQRLLDVLAKAAELEEKK